MLGPQPVALPVCCHCAALFANIDMSSLQPFTKACSISWQFLGDTTVLAVSLDVSFPLGFPCCTAFPLLLKCLQSKKLLTSHIDYSLSELGRLPALPRQLVN